MKETDHSPQERLILELVLPKEERGPFWQKALNSPMELTEQERELRDAVLITVYHGEGESVSRTAAKLGMPTRTVRKVIQKYREYINSHPVAIVREAENKMAVQSEVHRGMVGLVQAAWNIVDEAQRQIDRRLRTGQLKDADLIRVYRAVSQQAMAFRTVGSGKSIGDTSELSDDQLTAEMERNQRLLGSMNAEYQDVTGTD